VLPVLVTDVLGTKVACKLKADTLENRINEGAETEVTSSPASALPLATATLLSTPLCRRTSPTACVARAQDGLKNQLPICVSNPDADEKLALFKDLRGADSVRVLVWIAFGQDALDCNQGTLCVDDLLSRFGNSAAERPQGMPPQSCCARRLCLLIASALPSQLSLCACGLGRSAQRGPSTLR
jgi:hypothetical protein